VKPDMTGKVCVITGGNRGIGLATADALAGMGATVAIISRSAANGLAAVDEIIARTGNPQVRSYEADLASQHSIHQVADRLLRDYPQIDVLVNNAGAAQRRRSVTVDGVETVFAVNHLAYFLLTNLLLDAIKAAAPARIINVTSDAHQGTRLDFDDLQNERVYFGLRAYAQSKLANVYFTLELDRRLRGSGVTVNCMHPGFVATKLISDYFPLHFITRPLTTLLATRPEDGADTIIWLASAPETGYHSGKYFVKRREARSSLISLDAIIARQLWDVSAGLTGLTPARV
jgi:NAD(P)-dependent dehydrogenase (short-subunit alcohol dehydrogenase family)